MKSYKGFTICDRCGAFGLDTALGCYCGWENCQGKMRRAIAEPPQAPNILISTIEDELALQCPHCLGTEIRWGEHQPHSRTITVVAAEADGYHVGVADEDEATWAGGSGDHFICRSCGHESSIGPITVHFGYDGPDAMRADLQEAAE